MIELIIFNKEIKIQVEHLNEKIKTEKSHMSLILKTDIKEPVLDKKCVKLFKNNQTGELKKNSSKKNHKLKTKIKSNHNYKKKKQTNICVF
jgi:hypothetical protein